MSLPDLNEIAGWFYRRTSSPIAVPPAGVVNRILHFAQHEKGPLLGELGAVADAVIAASLADTHCHYRMSVLVAALIADAPLCAGSRRRLRETQFAYRDSGVGYLPHAVVSFAQNTWLRLFRRDGDVETVVTRLEQLGVPLDARHPWRETTPLTAAVAVELYDVAAALVRHGADPSARLAGASALEMAHAVDTQGFGGAEQMVLLADHAQFLNLAHATLAHRAVEDVLRTVASAELAP